jgi:hypothetical protein
MPARTQASNLANCVIRGMIAGEFFEGMNGERKKRNKGKEGSCLRL